MTKRRKYSPEFKREAVLLAQQPDASCRQIALDIGINPNLLSRWKRELAKVKKERDFLRKAATFFAKELP